MAPTDDSGNHDLEARISQFAQALREDGLRLTRQRLEVVREIVCNPTHPGVETVYWGVRSRVPSISLDTVYRTLAVLDRLGLIHRMEIWGGPVRYDPALAPHHHFICTHCGAVLDVYSDSYDRLEAPGSSPGLGRVESITVQLRGLCGPCQTKENE